MAHLKKEQHPGTMKVGKGSNRVTLTNGGKMRAVEEIVEGSFGPAHGGPDLEALCERLLEQQPQSHGLLKRLLARSQRVFAPLKDKRCPACNVAIATARIQQAKAGKFINCANCMVFLYHDPSETGSD
jgi:hypothetical protein